jgi:bifunctional non-homologous end joining protein LigD
VTEARRRVARHAPARRRAAPAPPAQFAPQLARLVTDPPSGPTWLHELKYDGYRIGCRINAGAARLLSRNGNDWTERFAPVAAAARRLRVDNALLDGEVAMVLPDGRTSFQALQNAGDGRGTLTYFVFDLLWLNGADYRPRPLHERKAALAALLRRAPAPIRYADHVTGDGARALAAACRLGAEGIVSKRADQPYRSGRGPGWLKTKCTARQELVIVGFTDPRGARAGLGALLVGTYDDAGALRFAGKVGTGFTQRSALELRRRLEPLARATSPLADPPRGALARLAHWVEPRLVAEVAFTEWTDDGKIRHPSFQGLREDKDPRSVRREMPAAAAPVPAAPPPTAGSSRRRRASATARQGGVVEVAGVTLTHPDRVLWRDVGITKAELAHYYADLAPWILPHLAGRPLTLVRCPQGVEAGCFFMKHWRGRTPAGLRRVDIREKHKVGEYLIADSPAALVALVQLNVIELHTWNSTIADLERPDRIVIDLDPGPDLGWGDVVAAARVVRDALTALALPSFIKTTGGRGLHVVIPLQPHADWSACLDFARRFSETVAAADPRRFTTNFATRGREKQILLDFMRNHRTNTSVAAYAARARPGAPVSMPIDWSELRPAVPPQRFTVRTALQRLRRQRRDPWQGYAAAATRIDAAARGLAALR